MVPNNTPGIKAVRIYIIKNKKPAQTDVARVADKDSDRINLTISTRELKNHFSHPPCRLRLSALSGVILPEGRSTRFTESSVSALPGMAGSAAGAGEMRKLTDCGNGGSL